MWGAAAKANLLFHDIVPAASMWTKKELGEFKESIRNEGGDSIIKVTHYI